MTPVDLALLVVTAVVGLIVGSFCTVLIDRVPQEEAVSFPWRCPSCRNPLSHAETLPVISWAIQGARCRSCGSRISVRYPFIELLTAGLYVGVVAVLGLSWELPAMLYLTGIGVALAFIDLDTMRLPNVLTLPSYPIVALLLALPAAADGAWDQYIRALLGAAAMFAAYLLLAIVNPAGMGMGDVKFAGVIGMALAWFGWDVWLVGVLLAFLLGAVVGIGMIVRGRGRGASIPFGPFMVAGALIAVLLTPQIAERYAVILVG